MPKVTASNNFRVYVNGEFVSCASEVELPEIELEMVEYEGLGNFGTPEFPTGIQALEASITWISFEPIWAKAAAEFTKAVKIQVRGQVDEFTSEGRTETTTLLVELAGLFKKNPLGSFSKNEFAEFESELAVHYVRQVFGGEEILLYDIVNNIYKANGTDLFGDVTNRLSLAAALPGV